MIERERERERERNRDFIMTREKILSKRISREARRSADWLRIVVPPPSPSLSLFLASRG